MQCVSVAWVQRAKVLHIAVLGTLPQLIVLSAGKEGDTAELGLDMGGFRRVAGPATCFVGIHNMGFGSTDVSQSQYGSEVLRVEVLHVNDSSADYVCPAAGEQHGVGFSRLPGQPQSGPVHCSPWRSCWSRVHTPARVLQEATQHCSPESLNVISSRKATPTHC